MDIPPSDPAARLPPALPPQASPRLAVPIEALVQAMTPIDARRPEAGYALRLSLPDSAQALEATSPRPLPPGTRLTLRVDGPDRARVISTELPSAAGAGLALQALRNDLPRQQPIAEALASIFRIAATQPLPAALLPAVAALRQAVPRAPELSEPATLARAIANSGNLLEPRLAALARMPQPSAAPPASAPTRGIPAPPQRQPVRTPETRIPPAAADGGPRQGAETPAPDTSGPPETPGRVALRTVWEGLRRLLANEVATPDPPAVDAESRSEPAAGPGRVARPLADPELPLPSTPLATRMPRAEGTGPRPLPAPTKDGVVGLRPAPALPPMPTPGIPAGAEPPAAAWPAPVPVPPRPGPPATPDLPADPERTVPREQSGDAGSARPATRAVDLRDGTRAARSYPTQLPGSVAAITPTDLQSMSTDNPPNPAKPLIDVQHAPSAPNTNTESEETASGAPSSKPLPRQDPTRGNATQIRDVAIGPIPDALLRGQPQPESPTIPVLTSSMLGAGRGLPEATNPGLPDAGHGDSDSVTPTIGAGPRTHPGVPEQANGSDGLPIDAAEARNRPQPPVMGDTPADSIDLPSDGTLTKSGKPHGVPIGLDVSLLRAAAEHARSATESANLQIGVRDIGRPIQNGVSVATASPQGAYETLPSDPPPPSGQHRLPPKPVEPHLRGANPEHASLLQPRGNQRVSDEIDAAVLRKAPAEHSDPNDGGVLNTLRDDLKARLLVLRALLAAPAAAAPELTMPAPRPGRPPGPLNPDEDAAPLLYGPRGLPTGGPTAQLRMEEAHRPRRRGGPEATAEDDTIVQLLRYVEGALARTRVQQLARLPEARAGQEASPPALWIAEIPFQGPRGLETLHLRLEQDGASRRSEPAQAADWRVLLRLDLGETGPMHALLRLRGKRIGATLWAERAATFRAARDGLEELASLLRQQGVDVEQLECRRGSPPESIIPACGPLLDVRT